MEIPARSQALDFSLPSRGVPEGRGDNWCRGVSVALRGRSGERDELAEQRQRLPGRGFPDGTITALLLAGISVGSKYPPSPINLALFYRVWETYHSKCVLLSCMEARHLLIPFLSYGVWNSCSLGE